MLAPLTSIEALNRSCYCRSTDIDALKRGLETDLQRRGPPVNMTATHPHLFAPVPMFVSRAHLNGNRPVDLYITDQRILHLSSPHSRCSEMRILRERSW